MRVPRSKIYRAFPELDRFDDHQCELLMQRVHLELAARYLIWLATAAAVVGAFAAVWIGWSAAGLEWARAIHRDGDLAVGAVSAAVLSAATGLLVRDALLRRYLIRAIELRIDRVRCRACKYVLIGQRQHGNAVTCPECGARNLLGELGVSDADLIPPTKDFEAWSAGSEPPSSGRGVASRRIERMSSTHRDPDPKRLCQVPTEMEAAMLVSRLNAAGIEAWTEGGPSTAYRAEAPGSASVLVPAADLERAAEIVAVSKPVPKHPPTEPVPQKPAAPKAIWVIVAVVLIVMIVLGYIAF